MTARALWAEAHSTPEFASDASGSSQCEAALTSGRGSSPSSAATRQANSRPSTPSLGVGTKIPRKASSPQFVGQSADPLREPVRLDRTNAAFHRLHALARLFLAGEWQGTTSGDQEGFALLFAMNDLFEAFVGQCLQIALAPRSVRLQRHDRHALQEGSQGIFGLKPDIVVDGDIVIDTKWKRLDPGKPNLGVAESDVYQMLAYARAYSARHLVLLYPWHEDLPGVGVCRRWRISGSCTTFDVATVDIGRPDDTGSSLREIVPNRA